MREQIASSDKDEKWVNAEQGFIDQFGDFLTREEAWKIADSMGQIRRPTGFETFLCPRKANVGDDGILFSENLY